jgi:hypothetical protein
LLIAAVAASAACAYHLPPVPVSAAARDLDRIVGSWSGRFETIPPQREGSILFRLSSARDTAYGDVVMTPQARDENGKEMIVRQALQPLAITFVRVRGRELSGTMKPYMDAELGCLVETRFQGSFRDSNSMEGTFATRDVSGALVRTGIWIVSRDTPRNP